MAENPIKKSDIADFDGIQKSVNELIASLEKLSKVFHTDLKASADEVVKSLQGVSVSTKEGQAAIASASKTAEGLITEQKQLVAVDKQLTDAKAKLNLLQNEGVQGKIKETSEIKKSISAKQKEITQGKAAADSYVALAAKLKQLAEQWRRAGESGRKNLGPEILKLENKLKSLDATIGRSQRNVGNYGSAFKNLGRQMLTALGLTGGLTALFNVVKEGFKTTIEFEKAMSGVKAVSGATNEQFSALRENAIALGGATKFTATEVAGLQKEYSKLGFTSDQILAMTKATLDLAAATGESLAQSAIVAGSTLRQFGLDATQMDMVVDVMAKSFSSSALDLKKFETSMQSVGPVANAVGVSLQRTTANLSVLANAGLDASVSGTSLRNIYLELERRGLTWEQAMQKINNTSNKASMSLELFGKRGAVAGLVLAENRVEADAFTKSYEDAAGAAKEMADLMQDNVAGSAVKLSSAWEGLVLRTNQSEGAMKGFLDVLTTVVSAINTKGKPAIDSLFETKTIDTFSDKFKLFRDTGVGFTTALVSAVFRGKEFAQEWSDELGKVGDEIRTKEAAENAARQKQTDADKKALADRTAIFEAQIEAEEKIREAAEKAQTDRTKAATAAREATSKAQTKSIQDQAKANSEEINAGAQDLSNELVDIKRAEIQEINDLEGTRAKFAKEINREILQDRIASAQNIVSVLADSAAQLTSIVESQKQRELSAAGDNAQKREEIERKYFEKQKALSIATTIINGASGVIRQFSDLPFPAALATGALVTVATLAEVAMIASQKFAEGGFTGKGGRRDETGERIAGIVHENEFVINKRNTIKYRPAIEAIHRDDPSALAAAVSHHEVWGNANQSIEFVRQDPFTEKMYELMKRQPVMYTDSNGDLVMRWPGGRVQVIKKK